MKLQNNKTKLWIESKICPECKTRANKCDCDFACPACKTIGQYDTENNILCPNDDCRVRRFFTQ